jgi:hypothetical protein
MTVGAAIPRYSSRWRDYYVTDIRNSQNYLGTVRAKTDQDACQEARERWHFAGTIVPRSTFTERKYQEAVAVERERLQFWRSDVAKSLLL